MQFGYRIIGDMGHIPLFRCPEAKALPSLQLFIT